MQQRSQSPRPDKPAKTQSCAPPRRHRLPPKRGRKDIGEDTPRRPPALDARRKRGLAAEALPLLVATRGTPPRDHGDFSLGENPNVTDGLVNCEPSSVYVSVHLDGSPQGGLLVRLARGREPGAGRSGVGVPWDANVRLEWVDAKNAARPMTSKADGQVVEKVLEDTRRSGYDICAAVRNVRSTLVP
ncbi:nudix domain-containing protein [Colletotrichum plurivorum]|uniref:Nudix domain-containing protein n=1 Tax=Colletotrichum plurivorum TaxID=2175906 RepID=A0A8H6NQA1_9PEZI|nr:nudix domain-containing protein [Colletotrichum plurivorum]